MREKDLEKYMTEQVRRLGGRAYKWTSPGNNGVPDRIVFLPDGSCVFVELKTEIGKLSKVQQAQINRLKQLGQDVRCLYGMGDVRKFLDWCWERKRYGV